MRTGLGAQQGADSPNEKRVIRMKFLEDKSDKEIAEQIGIAESSIRKYLQRAKKHIKDTVYRNEAET